MASGSGNVTNVISIGGASNGASPLNVPFSYQANLIQLNSGIGSSTGGNFLNFQKAGGTTQGPYQVTAGKTFYCIGMYVKTNVAFAISVAFGQGSATFVHNAGSTPPTGWIYYQATTGTTGAAIETTGVEIPAFTASTTEAWVPLLGQTFTAAYFPGYLLDQSAAQVNMRLIGYEV